MLVHHHISIKLLQLIVAVVISLSPVYLKSETAEEESLTDDALQASFLFMPFPEIRRDVLDWIKKFKGEEMAPALIYALRYLPDDDGAINNTLEHITGASPGSDWSDWLRWQQQFATAAPFEGFDAFQRDLFQGIDEDFGLFLYPGVKHRIRLEEIVWGGVRKDGIPALTNPTFVNASDATYLSTHEPVFGVVINGDVRAYPYRIMDWHEMFNDVIGGVPVSLAYCTLCGSGILYRTDVMGFDKPLIFGSSGFLYRSNKLMYDQGTHSLWNQFTGRPVVGKLAEVDIQLEILPVVTTTWGAWRKQHPNSKVLALDTGFKRDYSPGEPYGEYFASPELMFPVATTDARLNQKDEVFGLRLSGAEMAWPLSAFRGGRVLNTRAGTVTLVLIGDELTRTVRAYRGRHKPFEKLDAALTQIKSGGEVWTVNDDALTGPDGQQLTRLPGHIAYWFAWQNYFPNSELVKVEPVE